MALSLVAIGIAFDLGSGPVRWIAIASLIVYVGSFAVSWGWGFWLLNAELYPLEVRGRGTGLVVMVQWVANLAVSLTFLLLIHAIGKPATFWLYAGSVRRSDRLHCVLRPGDEREDARGDRGVLAQPRGARI